MPRTAGTTRRMRAALAAGLATAVLGPVGATSAAAADPPFVPGPAVSVLGEYTPIPGDFDGDGRDDVVWYRPGTGRDHLWQGTADGFVEGPRVNVDGNYTPIPGDFDGDGRDDILWNGFGAAPDPLWRGTPSAFTPGPTLSTTPAASDPITWYGRSWRSASACVRPYRCRKPKVETGSKIELHTVL